MQAHQPQHAAGLQAVVQAGRAHGTSQALVMSLSAEIGRIQATGAGWPQEPAPATLAWTLQACSESGPDSDPAVPPPPAC